MIGYTDLLPQKCRETFARQRVRRRWLMAYCGAALAIALGFSGASARERVVDDEHAALREAVEERLLKNEEATDMLAEIRDLEDRLTRYSDLAWPVRMSEVIASVGSIVPEGTTVTAFTLSPRTDKTRIPAKKGKPASEMIERWLVLELQGIAIDDFTVARIVSGLDENPLYQTVSLDFARPREVDDVDAREFRVHAQINLDARYDFQDVAAVGGDE